MKIDIVLLEDVTAFDGKVLKTVDISIRGSDSHVRTQVKAAMVAVASKTWGLVNIEAVSDLSIFGGYLRKDGGSCIVAR